MLSPNERHVRTRANSCRLARLVPRRLRKVTLNMLQKPSTVHVGVRQGAVFLVANVLLFAVVHSGVRVTDGLQGEVGRELVTVHGSPSRHAITHDREQRHSLPVRDDYDEHALRIALRNSKQPPSRECWVVRVIRVIRVVGVIRVIIMRATGIPARLLVLAQCTAVVLALRDAISLVNLHR
jgi:hypothetical protein